MNKRTLKWLLLIMAPLVLVALAAAWAWNTSSGAEFVLTRASASIPGELSWSSLGGSLGSELDIRDLQYSDSSVTARADRLLIQITPRFPPFSVLVSRLESHGLALTTADTGATDQIPDLEEILVSLQLPFALEFKEVQAFDSSYESADGPVMLRELAFSGHWHQAIELDHAAVKTNESVWDARLALALAPPFTLSGTVEESTPSQWRVAFEGVPGELDIVFDVPTGSGHRTEGTATLALGAETIGFSDLRLTVPGSGFSASGDGQLNLPTRGLEGSFKWTDFHWPLDTTPPDFTSPAGEIRLTGTFDDWTVEGVGDLIVSELEASRIVMSGEGNTHSARLLIDEASVLNGTLHGEARIDWTDQLDWSADFTANEVATTALLPDYPGKVSLTATARGEAGSERLDIQVAEMQGTLRGLPFSANGGLSVNDDQWIVHSVSIQSGESKIRANGGLAEPGGLELNLEAVDLSLANPGIKGRAQGLIRLEQKDGQFSYDANLFASGLQWDELQIAELQVQTLPGGQSRWLAQGIRSGEQKLQSLEVNSLAPEPLTDLKIHAVAESFTLKARLLGSVDSWDEPSSARWSGKLNSLALQPVDSPELALEQPAPLDFSLSEFSLGSSCVTVASDSRLCLEADRAASDSFAVRATLEQFPLDSLDGMIGNNWQLSQVADGSLSIRLVRGGALTGKGRVALSPGTVSVEGDEELAVQTGPGQISFDIEGGSLKNGQLNLELPGNGLVDIDFNVPELTLAGDSPVTGRIHAELADIGPLWRLMPVFDSIEGAVVVDTRVTGTLANPKITGRASLSNGEFIHEASGLTLEQIAIAGDVSNFGTNYLAGSFKAGTGHGNLTLELGLDDLSDPRIQLDLDGESLTLFDMKDLKLVADPDIRLVWEKQRLDLSGQVFVPEFLLSPTRLPTVAHSESSDVRIIAGTPSVIKPIQETGRTTALYGSLDVTLGSNARINLDVAELAVTGGSQFAWHGVPVPMAEGEFRLNGEILAYGQRLEVNAGRVGFPGVPADNPHLNIRAERQIYGNSQVQRAGLMIVGTLKQMVMEPYTVPVTTRERAQTLLVTGSDFDYEQGVGAVSVGTYVLPRLYLSYGIGVFEEGNVISARYDLSERFGVKATSGEKDTGLDLTYTIDR